MSVISSRTSSVASILRGPGVRSKLVNQSSRVHFKLPKNLRSIIAKYNNGSERKMYDDLICIIRDSIIKDTELIEFLREVHTCISLIGPVHKSLIDAILSIDWMNRSTETTNGYKRFLGDLVCAHNYHTKLIIDKMVEQFKSANEGATEWENGKPREKDLQKLTHVHDVLKMLLKVIPMASVDLLQSVVSQYPYMRHSTHSQEIYVHALLQILEYAPQLRSDILSLIINRLIVLDVNAPLSEIEDCMEEGMEEDEENDAEVFTIDDTKEENNENYRGVKGMKHPVAHTLDVCMEQVLSYIHNSCYNQGTVNLESLKSLYHEIIKIFEKVILPTHASHHVQFIMFYICSFKPPVAEAFINWLWRKVSNPNVAPIIRQSSVSYIASLLARATFIPLETLTATLSELSSWVHSYIGSQDSLECANSDVRVHAVFYAVCQAMFYVIAFRHRDLVDTERDLLFLQSLNLTKIVTCKLNPLRVCQPAVVQNFAAVTRTYQLAYCYTVIEHNARSNLPVLQNSMRILTWLDTFFPFDRYMLWRSGHRITPIYMHYQGSTNEDSGTSRYKDDSDEDDFIDESFPQLSSSCSHMDVFSYGTSPGFIHP